MSEQDTATLVHEGPSAGTLLRRAREASGLHVAALAVALKVPVRKLEALEQDRVDLLPDAVFARALASSVCRTLKVDPQPILERLPQLVMPRLGRDRDAINAPFRAPGDAVGPSWRDRLLRPVPLVVGGLLLAALVVFLLPFLPELPASVPSAPEPAAAAAPAGQLVEPAPLVIPSDGAAPGSASSLVTSGPAAVGTGVSGTTPQALGSPDGASPSGAGGVLASVALPADGAGLVVFRARGPSWVQVTDAKGVVTLRKLLAAGESVGASGALPLAVTVGSASTTDVQVRGKSMDLAPLSRDNVARFEVK